MLGNEDEKTKQLIVSGEYHFIVTMPEVLLTNKKWVDVFQSPSLSRRLVGVIIDELKNW